MEKQEIKANNKNKLEIEVGNDKYLRLPIKTPLLTKDDDLFAVFEKYVTPHLKKDDLVFISEKVIAVFQDRVILADKVKPGWLAQLLSSNVKNNVNTPQFKGYGHGTPVAMQLFIEEAGQLRVIFAAGVSAITRPLGIKGLFYTICGKNAKSVDYPMSYVLEPYTKYAKLAVLKPNKVAKDLKNKFGHDIAIVDANYLGVFSLGKSTKNIKEKFIKQVFKDNPLGQDGEMTPFGIVRKV